MASERRWRAARRPGSILPDRCGRLHASESFDDDRLSSDEVRSNEDAIQDLRFVTMAELVADREQLETWSRICVDHLASQS